MLIDNYKDNYILYTTLEPACRVNGCFGCGLNFQLVPVRTPYTVVQPGCKVSSCVKSTFFGQNIPILQAGSNVTIFLSIDELHSVAHLGEA